MKLIRTKGRDARKAEEILAALERRGGSSLDSVMPAVKRIVSDVRGKGDRALFRYASEFDGLKDEANLHITPEVREDHAAYIGSWLKVLKEDKRAIFSAASHASKAVDFLHDLQPQPDA